MVYDLFEKMKIGSDQRLLRLKDAFAPYLPETNYRTLINWAKDGLFAAVCIRRRWFSTEAAVREFLATGPARRTEPAWSPGKWSLERRATQLIKPAAEPQRRPSADADVPGARKRVAP
jgi:hypothetical protein